MDISVESGSSDEEIFQIGEVRVLLQSVANSGQVLSDFSNVCSDSVSFIKIFDSVNIAFESFKSFEGVIEHGTKVKGIILDVLKAALFSVLKSLKIFDSTGDDLLMSHSEKGSSFSLNDLAIEILFAVNLGLNFLFSARSNVNKDLDGIMKLVEDIRP